MRPDRAVIGIESESVRRRCCVDRLLYLIEAPILFIGRSGNANGVPNRPYDWHMGTYLQI